MEPTIFRHTIPKSAQGTYYAIPFTVPQTPQGLARVTVRYRYPQFARGARRLQDIKNIVDLGLADANGTFLGWSGSAKESVFVGPYAATNGYRMGEIEPGEWQILVGAYHIPDGGLTVEYEITFTKKEPRWLTGDLHMHSDASDGALPIAALAQRAKAEGLDFIAVANHNNYSENLTLPTIPGVTLLPAVEWTHYKGHINLFGAAAPFENSFVANSEADMLALLAHAKEQGALVSVNHPKCNLCPYLWESEDCFDMVEVWNGPMRPVNLRGIAWWHSLLVQKNKRIPLVGGSDFHKDKGPVRFGHPVTRVYSESPAAADILAALRGGRSYVSSGVTGPALSLQCGAYRMGDSVRAGAEKTLTIRAENLRAGMRLCLITDTGTAAEWQHKQNGAIQQTVERAPQWRFAYLAVKRRLPEFDAVRAISNPIYFDGR